MQKLLLIAGQLQMAISSQLIKNGGNNQKLISDTVIQPGGRSFNEAVYAKQKGYHVVLIGNVGSDNFGKSIKEELNKKGISSQYIESIQDSITGLVININNKDSLLYRFIDPGNTEDNNNFKTVIRRHTSICSLVILNQWLHENTCNTILRFAFNSNIPSLFICSSFHSAWEKKTVDFLFIDCVHQDEMELIRQSFNVRFGIFILFKKELRFLYSYGDGYFTIELSKKYDSDYILVEFIDPIIEFYSEKNNDNFYNGLRSIFA